MSTKYTNFTMDLLSRKQHHKERNHNQRSQVAMAWYFTDYRYFEGISYFLNRGLQTHN
jgi:hypothetical protein